MTWYEHSFHSKLTVGHAVRASVVCSEGLGVAAHGSATLHASHWCGGLEFQSLVQSHAPVDTRTLHPALHIL